MPRIGLAKGAYVLADAPGENPEVIIIATAARSAWLCKHENSRERLSVRACFHAVMEIFEEHHSLRDGVHPM